MVAVTDYWSGLGSSIVGGVVGALTVVLGASLAYWFGEKSRRAHQDHQDQRTAEAERRAAAAELMVVLSNLRDGVCARTKGLSGKANLWPMRNSLFTTHVVLRKYPSYQVVKQFYETALAWRQWVRDSQAIASSPSELQALYPVVDEYREALRRYGDQVIAVLQDHLEDSHLDFTPPLLPELPALSPDLLTRNDGGHRLVTESSSPSTETRE
jgi:hypothetical protein